MKYGGQSSVDTLKTVLVKRPDRYFAVDDYKAWGYKGKPDWREAQKEHDAFTKILQDNGVAVVRHTDILVNKADSIFVRDPVFITDTCALVLRMGKKQRRGESTFLATRLSQSFIPCKYPFYDNLKAKVEGGDLLWVNEMLVVGIGFRTNILGLFGIMQEVSYIAHEVALPYYKGPEHCLHLTSIISMISHDLAVAYLPLLPVRFYELLCGYKIEVIPVPDEEFETGAANVLALAPGKCLMLENNPVTQKRLEAAGCEVLTFKGEEICLNTEGGPTCLVNPILREPS